LRSARRIGAFSDAIFHAFIDLGDKVIEETALSLRGLSPALCKSPERDTLAKLHQNQLRQIDDPGESGHVTKFPK